MQSGAGSSTEWTDSECSKFQQRELSFVKWEFDNLLFASELKMSDRRWESDIRNLSLKIGWVNGEVLLASS